jgi:hypothetical protein
MKGFIEFKCKRCGQIEKNLWTPDIELTLCHIMYGTPLPPQWIGTPVSRFSLHCCPDGGIGVSEVLGGNEEKTKPPERVLQKERYERGKTWMFEDRMNQEDMPAVKALSEKMEGELLELTPQEDTFIDFFEGYKEDFKKLGCSAWSMESVFIAALKKTFDDIMTKVKEHQCKEWETFFLQSMKKNINEGCDSDGDSKH